MQIDTQGTNTASMNAHRAKQVHQRAGQVDEYDLTASDLVNKDSCEAMNLEEKHEVATVLMPNPDDKWVASADDDPQIIFKIAFTNPARLAHLIIRATKGPEDAAGPRTVKLFANNDNFDFGDADSPCAQKIELTREQIATGAKIPLLQIKFNRVTNLAVFIEDNQDDEGGGEGVTFLNRLALIGRPVEMHHTQYKT